MGFWIKVVKKEPRAKRVSTAYPFYPFTRFMHRLPNDYGSFGECLLQKDKRVNCLVWSRDDNCPLVEVITCKDCRYNDENVCTIDGFGIADDYFCAYAIRKERIMNREEAINKVEGCLTDYFPIEDYREVEEIIKALKEEPCEDAISRKSMLDYQQYLHGRMSNEENHKLWKFIKDLPPVTPAPKKCHNVNPGYAGCDQFVCSNCGIELQDWHRVERDKDDGDVTYHEYEFQYCPNCGARVDNEEDRKL